MEIIQRLKMEFRELLSLLTVEELIANHKLINRSEKVETLFVQLA